MGEARAGPGEGLGMPFMLRYQAAPSQPDSLRESGGPLGVRTKLLLDPGSLHPTEGGEEQGA